MNAQVIIYKAREILLCHRCKQCCCGIIVRQIRIVQGPRLPTTHAPINGILLDNPRVQATLDQIAIQFVVFHTKLRAII